MTSADLAAVPAEHHAIPRQWIINGGRIVLAVVLLGAWEWAAQTFGMLFFAPPLVTAQRIVEMAGNGKLFTDIVATLRVSALGFVIGCICGVALPFLLRSSERVTQAVEPFIMASQGIPKYALTPWLILWFGIGDAPKVIVVTLFVFYIVFITVFAGIRSVDQRLINMARVMGASEQTIARKVIWVSLLPYFFTGLKVALPRAVSAAIVGEFLVATEGIGFSIERARQMSDTPGVFAGIVVAVALVLMINAVVNALECYALRWRPTDRDMQI
jgi:NitT/TauT family transport system permease protein